MRYKLNDTTIRQLKPREKDYSISDGGGLRLMVRNSGKKVFVFNYNRPYTKKKNNLTIGGYPEISLQQARQIHANYRALLSQDIDPIQHRDQQQREQAERLERTFSKLAMDWLENRKTQANFSERTAKEAEALLNRHLLPHFGNYPISEITPLIAINAFKPLEQAGKLETLRKALSKLNDVMRYALHRGYIPQNVVAEIHKEFDKPTPQGMNTIQPQELAELLSGLNQKHSEGRFSSSAYYAVIFALLTASRPSEIAKAKWEDVNETEKTWAYTVQKGNKNRPEGRIHTVTLSNQAIFILRKMREINAILNLSHSPFIFASASGKQGHISIETMRKAIAKAIGEGRLTTHGIRHLFSTALNEQDFNADWIEQALSHKDRNRIRGTYNKAKYLEHRAEMLQYWGDYIESLNAQIFSEKLCVGKSMSYTNTQGF